MSNRLRLFGDVHGDTASYLRLALEAPSSIQLGDLGFKYLQLARLDPTLHKFVGGNHDKYELERVHDLSLDDPKVLDPRGRYTIIRARERFYLDDRYWFDTNTQAFLPQVEEDSVYEFARMPRHYLGNFGSWEMPSLDRKLFFVRGAWSIDMGLRIKHGWPWYPREQLSPEECGAAMALYEEEKPDFVVSHAAPMFVLNHLQLYFSGDGNPFTNATNRLLELMHQTHAPRLWVFAHYHQTLDREINGTRFICLDMHPREGWWMDVDKDLNISK